MLTKQEKAIMIESILRLYAKVDIWTQRDTELIEQLKKMLGRIKNESCSSGK